MLAFGHPWYKSTEAYQEWLASSLGLGFIPQALTMYPKNFAPRMKKAHLIRLNFIWYWSGTEKISSRSFMCSSNNLLFIIISSTYTPLISTYLILKKFIHQLLIGCLSIFQPKWHYLIIIGSIFGYKKSFFFVGFIHEDLMIARNRIQRV